MQSKAQTPKEYVASLPSGRRGEIEAVRKIILKNLPKGYEERMQYGMLGYIVPLKLFPAGYLDNPMMPLTFAALASQKNYMSLYLMDVYGDSENAKWFVHAYKKSGKKLNMGKSCIRFKKADNLPLDVIGEAIGRTSVKEFIKKYESSRSNSSQKSLKK